MNNLRIKLIAGILIIFLGISALYLITSNKKSAETPPLYVPEVVQETEVTPQEEEPKVVNMIFGGDIMMDRGVRASVNKNLGGDYNKLFENLGFLKTFDIVFANLEGPASNDGTKKGSIYSFRMDPIIIDALKNAGINVLSFSNNHIGDYGQEAFRDTMSRLSEAGIPFSGAGMNKTEAEQVTIIEKDGIKIGFLAFSDVGPEWMKATDTSSGALMANNPKFDEIVQTAASQVDFLVVSFHFGDEYKPIHNARQEVLAHRAVDNGAKIVIGHHPHVTQDFEIYKDAFIAYSLGNFVFDQSWSQATMNGMLLEIKLREDGNMTVKKNLTRLNKYFQPKIESEGVEEEIVFE